MYISGGLQYIASNLNQLPTGVVDVDSYVLEARSYIAVGVLTSGHLTLLEKVARLKKFQFTQSGQDLANNLI